MTQKKDYADIQRHIDNTDKFGDKAPPMLYRRDLLRRAKNARYGLGFRDIAEQTNLALNTVQQAFEGDAVKISTLWILCQYFGVPWIALFDLDRKLTIDKPATADADTRPGTISFGTDPKRYVIVAVDPTLISDESPRTDPPTSKKALGSNAKAKAAGKGTK